MTTADKIMALEAGAVPDDTCCYSTFELGWRAALEAAAALVEAEPPQAVRVKPLVWGQFREGGCVGRPKEFQYFVTQQHNGRFFCHFDESSHDHLADAQAHCDQHYQRAAIDLTPTAVDASPAPDPVSKIELTNDERLEYQQALIWCSAAADFAPEGQAREGWLKLCKPLIDRLPVDPVSPTPTLDALAMRRAAIKCCQNEIDWCMKTVEYSTNFRLSAAEDMQEAIAALPLPADAALAEAMRLPEVKERLEDDVTHSDDVAVNRFARAMKAKLAQARATGRSGWDDPAQCSEAYLAKQLVAHLGKGNPGTFEDVANFAMMLHQRGANPRVLKQATETQSYSEMLAEAMQLPEVKALVEAAEAVIRDFHGDNAIGVAHLTKLRAALKGASHE